MTPTPFATWARQYEVQWQPYVDPNAMFPPDLLKRIKVCRRHPKVKRFAGPRAPALYGSWATEMCGDCYSWRYNRGGCKGDRRWRGIAELGKLLEEASDPDWYGC